MNLLHLLSSLFMIFHLALSSPQCGLYGAPACTYLPAPPGTTPTCATPGKTYCESISHYPIHVIKQLISKWGYEINNLLVDETGENFDSSRYRPPPTQFFGPPPIIQHNYPIHQHHVHNSYPNTDDGYKYPNPNIVTDGYSYKVPNRPFNTGGAAKSNTGTNNIFSAQYSAVEPIYIPTPTIVGQQNFQAASSSNYGQSSGYYIEQQQVAEYNSANILRRYNRDLSNSSYFGRSKRDTLKSILLNDYRENEVEELQDNDIKKRTKRQSAGREALCQINSQFITPQAALNSRGNWMYVINQVESARQLVKTETCASSVCSNLCQVPNGYTSRCEQKFVQKRLIALNSNGQNLYTDTFWFPSCCVCTISNQ